MSSLSPVLPFFQESFPPAFIPHDVVNLVGEFLEPECLQDFPSLYGHYQHDSMRIELYKAMQGTAPQSLKTFYTEAQIQEIRLRTQYLEDWAVTQCFMAYCKRHPLSQDSETEICFQTQLCLRGNKTPLCPLAARVQRLIDLYPSVDYMPTHISAHDFLPGTSELLQPLVDSVVEIPLIMLSRHHVTQNPDPIRAIRRPFLQLLKALAIRAACYTLVVSCIVLYTAIKIAVFMASTILVCAVVAPFVIAITTLTQGRVWQLPTSMTELKSYIIICMGIGAVVGMGGSIYRTLPYIKNLWKTRHMTIQLHRESFMAFKRLWVDYTRTFGRLAGSRRLISALLKSDKTPDPAVVRQT